MNYQECIEEYKTFQNEYDKIYLEDDRIWIQTGYGWSNKEIHIHYNHNYWGSDRFNEWLNKWNLKWEWYDVGYGYAKNITQN